MGKIIQDGFMFMERVNAGLIRKIDDIPELKKELISISEEKTHLALSHYAVLLAEHILEISAAPRMAELDDCISINVKWQNKEVRFQEARNVAGVVNDLAREEKDPVQVKVFRAFGQIAATPHVRWHALAASEYAVVITNLLYPEDFEKVKEERMFQIQLMKQV